MSIFLILFTSILGLLLIFIRRWAKLYDVWKERGIVHRKPYILVGNMLENVLKKKTLGEIFREIALEFKGHKYVGIYNFISAGLLITDADYIQNVLVKEFSHFMDRGPKFEGTGYMEKHMFLLSGAEWKGVRAKVSPAFSSGKLKGMFPLMAKSYDYTSKYLDKLIETNNVVNVKDILDMYIVSVSASTIYGMDPSRLAEPNSEFKRILDEQSKLNFRQFITTTIAVFFPRLLKLLKLSAMPKKIENYYIDLILNTFKERTESGIVRDDIIQQLLQLKQTGKIEVNQWINEDVEELGSEPSLMTETIEITDEILVSQGFIFLMAGFDPMKSFLAMLLIELCQNTSVLDKAKEEIATCVAKYDGFTWQAVKEMQYLDWCMSETLRMHPPVETNSRHCVKDFTFPDGFTIKAGTAIIIPTLKMHYDPTYYPEPEKFKPERFETAPPASAFMPFGLGPRMCLARRFALQEMKLFAAKIINDYDISIDSKTELPVRTEKWFFLRRHESDIYLQFKKKLNG